jgi:dethiobiotin synthetase/malonyl-CoA O-methyltransferase
MRYWKPIQTGMEQDDDTAEVRRLGACHADEVLEQGVRLSRPLSPHLAARLENRRIDIPSLLALIPEHDESSWLVEGAGGALVPVNESALMVDLMTVLGLPVLIVARTALGTINHTLLTVEAVQTRKLTVAGVLMVGEPNPENRAAIETYGRVSVIGELPPLDPLTPETLGRWATTQLDREGVLEVNLASRRT